MENNSIQSGQQRYGEIYKFVLLIFQYLDIPSIFFVKDIVSCIF